MQPLTDGAWTADRLQRKANVAFTPLQRFPITFYGNYGRGISTADARAVIERPRQQRIATTDFYQAGAARNFQRVSVSADLLWIDRSHEQVYIPDDGSFEFKGPSRAYGFEAKSSVHITRHIAWSGAVMKLANAYYRGATPRIYLDSAPHFVASSGLLMSPWKLWTASVTMRAINRYRLDGLDAAIVASGHTVFNAAVSRQVRRGVELSLSADNLTNRDYYENYFVSRLSGSAPVARIHGTPGYPLTLTAGVTIRLFGK